MADEREIAAYYDRGEEQGRLADWGRLEFLRTRELLARFLPAPPATVLDVGGAAGAYALPLAAEGYEVHLVDPVALHVEQARAASAAQPDAPLASAASATRGRCRSTTRAPTSSSCSGRSTTSPRPPTAAAPCSEARRALRPGGLLAAAAITRFASTLDGVAQGFLLEPGFEAIVERDLADGQHRNPGGHPGWFTTAYFHRPDELEREVAAAGFDVTALASRAPSAPRPRRTPSTLARRPRQREVLCAPSGA